MNRRTSRALLLVCIWACVLCLSEGKLCLMMFQMADNDLEAEIRADNFEFINSKLLKESPDMTSWIYFDARNSRDITEPLEEIYNPDGSPVTEKFEGSRYFSYDHAMEKMVVRVTLEGEQDSDDPLVLKEFTEHALRDCVSRGSDEYMFLFSSHGGGFKGFGGDDAQDAKRRRLEMSNPAIAIILHLALRNVPGAPEKLDVLGFDACLMMSFEAIDDFVPVADYYIASEAVEPGHGWAYDELVPGDAMDVSKQIVVSFLNKKQGINGMQRQNHASPKTLAVVDTEKYKTFLVAWENLCKEFTRLLRAGNEPEFISTMERSRAESIAFEGVFDAWGDRIVPNSVDIGSFISIFTENCDPDNDSELSTRLLAAQNTYDDMFVIRGVGEGTVGGTGMHITWPIKSYYYQNKFDWDLIFNETIYGNYTSAYHTYVAPNFNEFFDTFMTTEPHKQKTGHSCKCQDDISGFQVQEGQLLLNPSYESVEEGVVLKSKIHPETDYVLVEFAVDLTVIFFGIPSSGRHLNEISEISEIKQSKLDSLKEKAQSNKLRSRGVRTYQDPRRNMRRQERHRSTGVRRNMAEDNDENLLLLFGGDVGVSYGCASFRSVWNRRFFAVEESSLGVFEPVYITDTGMGSKSLPVMYFPTMTNKIRNDIVNTYLTLDEAEAAGALHGYLTFATDEETGDSKDNFVLFTFGTVKDDDDDSSSEESEGKQGKEAVQLSERPLQSGGYIVPITYIEGTFGGVEVDYFLGGFRGSIIDWREGHNITMTSIEASDLFALFNNAIDTTVIDVYAVDYDAFYDEKSTLSGSDFSHFELTIADVTPPFSLAPSRFLASLSLVVSIVSATVAALMI